MKIYDVLGNSQKLDGGAMFGNAPKPMWEKWLCADDKNRIDLVCRAMLVQEDSGRNVLFEVGVGAFFEPTLKDRYGIQEKEHVLLDKKKKRGLTHEDIGVVVLSHLHFDHAGGLLTAWQEGKEPQLLFPNAKYVVSEDAFLRALNPHFRDRASFIPFLPKLLESSGRLYLVKNRASSCDLLGDCYKFHYSDGHTPGMLLTEVITKEGPIVFAADLIPGTAWVHLPITMGYDRYAEKVIDEKEALLGDLESRGGRFFYTHDPLTAASHLKRDDKGRFQATDLVSVF